MLRDVCHLFVVILKVCCQGKRKGFGVPEEWLGGKLGDLWVLKGVLGPLRGSWGTLRGSLKGFWGKNKGFGVLEEKLGVFGGRVEDLG